MSKPLEQPDAADEGPRRRGTAALAADPGVRRPEVEGPWQDAFPLHRSPSRGSSDQSGSSPWYRSRDLAARLQPHPDADQCARSVASRLGSKPQFLRVRDAAGGLHHRYACGDPADPSWCGWHRPLARELCRHGHGGPLSVDQRERRPHRDRTTRGRRRPRVPVWQHGAPDPRRMAADPRWRALSSYVLATGIVMLVLFIVARRLCHRRRHVSPWSGRDSCSECSWRSGSPAPW